MREGIGFDLDGVFVGRPPFVPQNLIEWLYKDQKKKALAYRIPGFIEQKIRQLSHLSFVRPALKNNCEFLRNLKNNKKYHLYLISGRFGFLNNLTYSWLKKHNLTQVFEKIYLNSQNEQPHLFKEKMLRKVGVKIYVDDDFDSLTYLSNRFKNIHFYYYSESNTKIDIGNITAIDNLDKILE